MSDLLQWRLSECVSKLKDVPALWTRGSTNTRLEHVPLAAGRESDSCNTNGTSESAQSLWPHSCLERISSLWAVNLHRVLGVKTVFSLYLLKRKHTDFLNKTSASSGDRGAQYRVHNFTVETVDFRDDFSAESILPNILSVPPWWHLVHLHAYFVFVH